jgi:two-component system phosphate regulon sensor histidine kinase PhoR
MRRRRLLWQLYPSYLLITLFSLLGVAWYATTSLRNFYYEHVRSELVARAVLVKKDILRLLEAGDSAAVDALCKEMGKISLTRITVILPSGQVIGDTDEDPARMDNHADRPEVIEALTGQTGKSIRYSHTLRESMMYVTIPINAPSAVRGVIRTAIPVTAIDRALRTIYWHISLGGLAIAAVAAAMSLAISRRISRPIEEIKRGAERFAKGELEHKLPVYDSQEIGGLAEAMNQMAAQLDDRIRAIVQQRNELEVVLSSMVEGVLAVDMDERLIKINRAAAQMIGVDAAAATGRSIQEIVRNTALQQFVARALKSREPVEGDIIANHGGERSLQAHGTMLRDAQGRSIGALIVLNDVTRLRQLENMRREFVANVSHELKTPITSIKGFVETLLQGAMSNPEDAQRFLGIIAKHAERLHAIIEDLLSLSRVEQESERREIALEPGMVKEVLTAAIQACRVSADAKNITIELACEEKVRARLNAALLEQAVVNLLDNAIKYSEPGSVVQIAAARTNGEVAISVRDHGCGIRKEHIPRLFERFYRVDKARSRKLGGTGLGLAIVKHIVQAHSGQVSVQSTPGEGSTFTIRLPAA